MPAPRALGQALPEYLLTLAALLLLVLAGTRAWQHALLNAEEEQARILSLPSP